MIEREIPARGNRIFGGRLNSFRTHDGYLAHRAHLAELTDEEIVPVSIDVHLRVGRCSSEQQRNEQQPELAGR